MDQRGLMMDQLLFLIKKNGGKYFSTKSNGNGYTIFLNYFYLSFKLPHKSGRVSADN
jgi:hypothetical protein